MLPGADRVARNDALDAVRAIAMMFVVAGHAVLSFLVTPIGWAVQDRSQFLGADLFAWIVRAFAMPTFFWLSGYAGRSVLESRGARAYARHGVTRMLVPLAVALVPCSLVVGALWDWGREVTPRALVADNVPKLQSSELPIMLGHLWYLYYLLGLLLAAWIAASVARSLRVRIPGGLGVLAVPALLTIGVLVELGALHTDTPLGFVPDVRILVFMGGFFAWGWLVRGRPEELVRYARFAWHALVVALGLLAVVIATLYRGLDAIERPPLHAIAASGLFAIATMVGFIGLCVRYGRPHPVVRLASVASYWFYVAHLPIVVALQIALAGVAVPGLFKYVAIVSVTTVVCLGSYVVVARRRSAAATGK
ncbi:MAG: acyltransferase 3 [Myxococcales bacterium]|nr:acyltransferase 3 [Myxococcales bacterium]